MVSAKATMNSIRSMRGSKEPVAMSGELDRGHKRGQMASREKSDGSLNLTRSTQSLVALGKLGSGAGSAVV